MTQAFFYWRWKSVLFNALWRHKLQRRHIHNRLIRVRKGCTFHWCIDCGKYCCLICRGQKLLGWPSYNTRLKDNVHLYRTNIDYGKRSLKYRAAKYYNDLPKEIKFKLNESGRYNKSVLKNYLLNNEHWSCSLLTTFPNYYLAYIKSQHIHFSCSVISYCVLMFFLFDFVCDFFLIWVF